SYPFRALLVDLEETDLIQHASEGGEWRLAYFDECVALLVRRGAPDVPGLATDEEWQRAIARVHSGLPAPHAWADLGAFGSAASPTPSPRLANFLLSEGRPADAEAFLRDALVAYPASARARITYARLLEHRGNRSGARRQIEEAYVTDPRDPEVA